MTTPQASQPGRRPHSEMRFRMDMLVSLKAKAKQLKQHTLTVYFAARDPRAPFSVRALAMLAAAYALSPIDLIPDFIPVLGYLDDLILIPPALALVVRLLPKEVLESAQTLAQQAVERPVGYSAACFIALLWLFALWLVFQWARGALQQLPA